MRLRYLHLPRCGPLADIGVVFGREDLISKSLNLPRKGSLNFVVGVNGSGKSSLLRAIYGVFRSLNRRERPTLPVTLAWDRTIGSETVTALLHYENRKDEASFFATFNPILASERRQAWEEIIIALSRREPHPLIESLQIVTGHDAITSPMLFARLPKRLIVYTSGADDPWMKLDHPVFHPKEEEEDRYQTEDERPQDWSMDKEWKEVQQIRISRGIRSYEFRTGANTHLLPIANQKEEWTEEVVQQFGHLEAIQEKVLTNHMLRTEALEESYFRIYPQHLRLTGITLALWQTAKELTGRTDEPQREAFRNNLLHRSSSNDKPKDARRVLNEIDWFWPTHLSLTYRDADDRISPRQRQELLCLVALADEVIAQPRGRKRAVFSLGPSDRISLTDKLKEAFPFGIPGTFLEDTCNRVDACKTGAEAILRIFSADRDIDSTPMDVFARFRDWERTGLFEDITLTVKRLHRPESTDGEPDDIIVTYDQLSDGEQMLLGRMGLLFLLRGQDGSLLLLDEPETHFNDVWKREIVEMVDTAILSSTESNVVIATHTSIALTDAFAAEVTVLDKTAAGITARSVSGGLFGTDPGEVTMNLFRADSNIGSRSVDLLEQLLKTEWKNRENELEAILNLLGSSFHRAELRAVLKKLREKINGPASR